MFSARKIVISLIIILTSHFGKAQGLYAHKLYGPYLYLFRLDGPQMEYAIRNQGRLDSQILYTHLAGKISIDSIIPLRCLPRNYEYLVKPFLNYDRYQRFQSRMGIWDIRENGYFLEVRVSGLNQVSYRLLENPLFNSAAHRIGYETFIFVEDTAGLPVTDATVTLDTSRCLYDESVGGYKISGKNIFGHLKIQRGSDFTLGYLNGYQNKQNNTQPPRDRYNYAKIHYQGYLVTNKPRYKQWDTLFFKSFLVNAKGKPIKEKLIARLYQNYSGFAKSFTISPADRGDYHGYFVISDSFMLDQPIGLNLMNARGEIIKSQELMLENYELKNIQFSLRADKTLVTPGAGIRFFAEAANTNRLPIMDGKLTLKIRPTYIRFFDQDSVVISDQKMQEWYKISLQTDPSGITIFDIPDSIFIPMSGSFIATCYLQTADNELREYSVNFNYETTRDRQEASLNGDSLHVIRMYNMKSVRKAMRIKIYSRKDLLADSVFHTPFHAYIPPNIYSVQIYQGDTLTGTFYRQTQLPDVWGNRTHDSVHIYFQSQKDIPVFYRIYANNQLVAKGHATELNWHRADKKKNSYHIQYGILEGNVTVPRFYSKSFHLAERALNITINTPGTVYPGQDVAVEVIVKDAWGKPVKKVNLAAWAVNEQMEGIVTPDVPYLGLVKPQKSLPTQYFSTSPYQIQQQGMLAGWQVDGLNLRHNKFYELVYPKNGFEILTDTTPQHSTEVGFYGHNRFGRINFAWIKMDDTLLTLQGNPNESIRIKPGKHRFSIRTYNRIFTFQDVNIAEGKKNFLCLNLDSLITNKAGDTISPGILKYSERQHIAAHTLLFRMDQPVGDTLIVRVNKKVFAAYPYGYSLGAYLKNIRLMSRLFNPGMGQNKYTTWQDFFLLPGLKEGDLVEIYFKNHYSHQFYFQPGVSHSFTPTEHIADTCSNWTLNLNYISMQSYAQSVFNTFWFDPYYEEPKKKTDNPYIPPTYYQTNNLPEFQHNNYSPYGDKKIQNANMHLYLSMQHPVKKLWLFERNDSSLSFLENYNAFGEIHSQVNLAARRNIRTVAYKKGLQHFRLVLQENDTLWLVKNIDIDSSTELFLTLDPAQFRKLGQREYFFYDRLAKNIAREELIKWLDTPTFNKGLTVYPVQRPGGNTSIEGTVIGPDIKYTVDHAFVVLERNGNFVQGAWTNREGRFVMEKLQPGTYMLKIKGENYHYWVHYAVNIQPGMTHLLQAKMQPHAEFAYSLTSYDINEPVGAMTDANGMSFSGDYSASGTTPMHYYTSDAYENVKVETLSKTAYSVSRINARASRKDASATYVDGAIAISSDADGVSDQFEEAALDTVYGLEWNSDSRKKESDRLNVMAGDANARRIRRDFRDYAYWIPTLFTNKQGKAGFTVHYPDNVTSWKTFVPAMDGKRHSGLGEITVRAYKPVVTSLGLPLFLTEGDSLTVYSRVLNYTGENLNGKFGLKYRDHSFSKDITLNHVYTDSLTVTGPRAGDTLDVESYFELTNGYRDGEFRRISIGAASVIGGKSLFTMLAMDTTLVFAPDSGDIGMQVAVYNHKLGLILEQLKRIETLPAYDNRSTAQLLTALLSKKKVCNLLGMPFGEDRRIREIMGTLKKAQGSNGLFGWFGKSSENWLVSTSVAEAMFFAQEMGFDNNTWLNAARRMENQLPHVWGNQRLEYLLCLKKLGRTLDYDSFMKPLNPGGMNQTQKLLYLRLKQLLGKPVDYEEIYPLLQPTTENNLMVQGSWEWRIAPVTDDAANTWRTWQILFDGKKDKGLRNGLVNYLVSECPAWGNAWIRGSEAMLTEIISDSNLMKELKPVVTANGSLIPLQSMPKIFRLKPGQKLELGHSGAPVYIAMNRTYRTYHPVSDGQQFRVSVTTPGIKNQQLTAGQPFEMKVTVLAARNQFNSVIDIPIPAGCVYAEKIQGENYTEIRREYQPDRVLIFSEEMPFGSYTFTIRLVPKFSGVFHTAPARAALMFYPDRAGYSQGLRWTIVK